ncbi:MAG: secondary thiamine-phosphate synthase enzyme YjbQ [Candidatus Omnitrophica bacterium]|nr:secondary thiamine-phosphate synthase enzyme YjbQ [Candidatus Omnitrophota bacterium]MCF7876879.1 secondary thiamine-phosphate synthase enzyme YjbQ [Candidatus Omnitrophota bacterium]MCF7877946.1 secondary thiamine-phosphate synthase enzyme YjbQ [Candidatus Omnitrophota bacterium]MCF7892693.1 secondary thiamine-phosphate synthase enzyme YjbQ [Candidatus Omnitrophota bacterium]
MESIAVNSKKRNELVDISLKVKEVVKKSGVKEGVCILFCAHTTAALTINENADPSVQKDIINYLNRLVPADEGYLHAEGNSDSHIKSSLLGADLQIIIEKEKLALGTWQGIYFCEFDGPRSRKVYVKIINQC